MVECPDIVRKAILSDVQIELFKYIEKAGKVYSREIAEEYSWSVQNATMKLRKLYEAGYLKRIGVAQESGGIEYQYYSALRDAEQFA